jgi:hypothetical protein
MQLTVRRSFWKPIIKWLKETCRSTEELSDSQVDFIPFGDASDQAKFGKATQRQTTLRLGAVKVTPIQFDGKRYQTTGQPMGSRYHNGGYLSKSVQAPLERGNSQQPQNRLPGGPTEFAVGQAPWEINQAD